MVRNVKVGVEMKTTEREIWERALATAKEELNRAEQLIVLNKELIKVSSDKLRRLPPALKKTKPAEGIN